MAERRSPPLLGLRLAHPELLRQALAVPRPRVGGRDPQVLAKERLEYLGDAVIAYVVSAHLFRTLPDATEGVLSALRSATVSAPSLALIAEQLGVPEALGVANQRAARHYTRLLASTLEAIVGAAYCDAGLDAASAWIAPRLEARVAELQAHGYLPAKNLLQEHTQGVGRGTPVYRLVGVIGKPHERTYTVEVEVDGRVFGRGSGPSRRAAEQAAAAAALETMA